MKFLVFQHVAHETPGMFLDIAKAKNIELEIIKLWKEYSIPSADKFYGLIIMGGSMGVYENYISKVDELAFIRANVGKLPMIGFCLGSQLLAHALGADVYQNQQGGKHIKEIGFYDITLTKEGMNDPIFKGFSSPVKVLQWHGDAFDLPVGATLLATSPLCTNQAFRYGTNIYAMLFHNEFTPEMIEKQIETDKEWIHKDFNMDENKLKIEAREYAEQMKKQCVQLFENFCEITNLNH